MCTKLSTLPCNHGLAAAARAAADLVTKVRRPATLFTRRFEAELRYKQMPEALERADHAEQILKVRQAALPRWRQLRADGIAAQAFTEAVPRAPVAAQRHVEADGHSQDRVSCDRSRRRQCRVSDTVASTSRRLESNDAHARRQIRADRTPSFPEVHQEVADERMLRARARRVVKRRT